jgi:hypothetical protein
MKTPIQHLTTEEFAFSLGLRPQTLRASVSRHGNYFGFPPVKLPNGRLIWRIADRDALLRGETGPQFDTAHRRNYAICLAA